MNDPITFSLISTEHEKQIVFRSCRLMWERGEMVVLNAPGKYQYDLSKHLLVNLFLIALDAAITASNVNNHELHRNNIPATLSGNSGITDYVPPGSVMNQQAYNRYSSIISSSSRFSRFRATAQLSSSACDLCFNSSVQGCMEWAHIKSYQHSHIRVW